MNIFKFGWMSLSKNWRYFTMWTIQNNQSDPNIQFLVVIFYALPTPCETQMWIPN
jgi:hypothetical protein